MKHKIETLHHFRVDRNSTLAMAVWRGWKNTAQGKKCNPRTGNTLYIKQL